MKRKGATLQRTAIAVLSILLAVSIGVTAGATSYRTLICNAIGGEMYRLEGGDDSDTIQLYETNGMTQEEWKTAADQLEEEIEAEVMVLLKNEGPVLPLDSGMKLSLFSRSSVDLVLGGTGAGGIDESKAVDLRTALEGAGFTVNPTLWEFYKGYDGKDGYTRSNGGYTGANPEDIFVAEVPINEYTDAVRDSYKDYSDAAVVVISRVGGEGSDMPTGDFGDGTKYLALQEQEKDLLMEIQESGQFDKVIVLINSSNAMELGWLDQEEYGIDACLWVGGVGQSGARAIAGALAGTVNPSGRLVDTYAADSLSAPAMQNFGDYTYTNAADVEAAGVAVGTKYVVYAEGIYVGYRYYETRYADSVLDPVGTNAASSAGAFVGDTWNYTDEVCYSFGYGLSYGAEDGKPFVQELVSAEMGEDGLTVTVRVTNTGTAAGKDVVQLYAQQPYTAGGIEKSAIQLIGFEKTGVLEPGASETVTITADKYDFASYDYKNDKTFVLDSGSYYFAVGDSAHDALNNVLAAQGKTVDDGMDESGNAALAYTWNNPAKELLNQSYSGNEITNRFDSADLEYYGQDVEYLTRSDWNTFPESYDSLTATDEMIYDMNGVNNYKSSGGDLSQFQFGVDSQMTIAKMVGVPLDDDEQWDKILNQLTMEEMADIVTRAARSPIPSIGYPAMAMNDGPQGVNRKYTEDGTSATGYCGAVVRASTFNRELIRRMGEAMGEDWLRTDTEGAYTPAVNTHRTPYAGRNFEYYSEDGFLAGELAYEEVMGMQSKGAICYIKHFALNDQETNRTGICTFSNEQAIREIYLKAFEKSFTEGASKGTMGAFNRIGCVWAGAYAGLMTDIVRTEWGSTAIIITDIAINTAYQHIETALAAGGNMWATSGSSFYNWLVTNAPNDAAAVEKMRESCKIILYNVASSSGMNGLSPTGHVVRVTPYWETAAYAVIAVLAVLDLAAIGFMVYGNVKARKTEVEK